MTWGVLFLVVIYVVALLQLWLLIAPRPTPDEVLRERERLEKAWQNWRSWPLWAWGYSALLGWNEGEETSD